MAADKSATSCACIVINYHLQTFIYFAKRCGRKTTYMDRNVFEYCCKSCARNRRSYDPIQYIFQSTNYEYLYRIEFATVLYRQPNVTNINRRARICGDGFIHVHKFTKISTRSWLPISFNFSRNDIDRVVSPAVVPVAFFFHQCASL